MTNHFIDWYKIYLKCYDSYKITHNIDLSKFKFIDPVIIVLLFKDLITLNNSAIKCGVNVKNYLNFLIKNYNIINGSFNNYIPVVTVSKANVDILTSQMSKIVMSKININSSNLNIKLNYIFGELMENIIQHSRSKHNYILSQYYNKLGLELTFYDDGIGIPGSLKVIKNNTKECDYIFDAINGLSSKMEPGLINERGTALPSINKMVKSYSNNEFIIISGSGIYSYSNGNEQVIPLNKKYRLNGTLISILFKDINKFDAMDIYKYV